MHGHTPKAWRIELQMQPKYSAKEAKAKNTASILYAKSVPNNSSDTFLQITKEKMHRKGTRMPTKNAILFRISLRQKQKYY